VQPLPVWGAQTQFRLQIEISESLAERMIELRTSHVLIMGVPAEARRLRLCYWTDDAET